MPHRLVTGPPASARAPLAHGQVGRVASREVALVSLQRSPAAPYRPRVTSLRTIPLRRSSGHCTQASAGPSLRFSSPRVSGSFEFALETPPGLTIRKRRLSPAYRIRPWAVIAAWPGLLDPATLLGFDCPFAVLLRPAGRTRASSALPWPTCRFAVRPPRRLLGGGTPAHRVRHGLRAAAPGRWPRESAVPCSSADPAMAFMHRVARTHRPVLPWVFNSSLRCSTPAAGLHF